MADKKISALTAASTPLAGTEVLPIVQSGATVKVAVSDLTAGRAISATSVTASTGNFVVGTSGQGVDFSATPGTGTSELLADYEEGNWTPVVTAAVGSITTVGTVTGQYTKVGNVVTIIFRISITLNGTGSLILQVDGLPYTPSAFYNCGAFRDFGGITSKMGSVGIVASNTKFNMLYYDGTYPGADAVYLAGSVTYQV